MAEKDGGIAGNATGEVGADHLRALGRITVNFGNLKLWLALAICSLLETDGPTSQTVSAETSFRARLNLLSSLARAKLIGDAALAADVTPFIRDADTCEQARNQIVHSHWLVAPNDHLSRMKFTAKSKGLQTQSEEMPSERMTRSQTTFAQRSSDFSRQTVVAPGRTATDNMGFFSVC